MPIVISTLVCLLGTSAMKCWVGFSMENCLFLPEELLIPFPVTHSIIVGRHRLMPITQVARRQSVREVARYR